METKMSKEITDLLEKFHGKALDAKTHNERGTSTMNEIYEGLMSMVLKKDKLAKYWEEHSKLITDKMNEYIKINHDLEAVVFDFDEERLARRTTRQRHC